MQSELRSMGLNGSVRDGTKSIPLRSPFKAVKKRSTNKPAFVNENNTFSQDSSSNSSDHFPLPGTGPLLGLEELQKYLGGERVTIQVTTWNMGSLPLPKEHQLRKLFFHDEDDSLKQVDIHVISIQECWPDGDAWELELQICLGPGYALFHSLSFGTLHLAIFLRRDLLWFTTEPSDLTMSVRAGRLFKTKGSAAISFGFFGTKLLFINAHLSAGEEGEREKDRIIELQKILAACQKQSSDPQSHSDAIFLSGDLNFRVSQLSRDDIIDSLRSNNFERILASDQLVKLLKRPENLPKSLQGFNEAATITFRPTYKYDIGSDEFDSSAKQRSPAYTDRILYKFKQTQNINDPPVICLAYEMVTNLRLSDHRPVYSVFSVQVKPGFDTLPLSGARFKKDLFTKGVQRRAKFLLDRRKKLASQLYIDGYKVKRSNGHGPRILAAVIMGKTESKIQIPTDSARQDCASSDLSHVEKEPFFYTWVIEDIGSIEKMVISESSHKYKILSPKFRAGRKVNKLSEWYLTLGGGTSGAGRFVTLYLVLSETFWEDNTSDSVHVYFCARAALGPHKIEKEFGLTVFKKSFDTCVNERGWESFVPHELLTDEDFGRLEGKQLVIDLEMEIWEDQHPTLSRLSDSANNVNEPAAKRARLSPEIWRSNVASQVLAHLYADYKAGRHLDVEIHAGGSVVLAHKCVLETRSAYFRNLIQECERTTEAWVQRLVIPEMNEQVLRSTVEYMYTGKFPSTSRDNLNCALEAAQRFQMNDLKGVIFLDIISSLERNCKPDVMLESVVLAHCHLCPAKDKEIFQSLKHLFTINKDALKTSPRFADMFRSQAEAFLKFI